MTPKELKERFPLAFDTIKWPVRYDIGSGFIFDNEANMVLEIRGWGYIQKLSEPEQRQDQIGELSAHLLNQLQ